MLHVTAPCSPGLFSQSPAPGDAWRRLSPDARRLYCHIATTIPVERERPEHHHLCEHISGCHQLHTRLEGELTPPSRSRLYSMFRSRQVKADKIGLAYSGPWIMNGEMQSRFLPLSWPRIPQELIVISVSRGIRSGRCRSRVSNDILQPV
jgi:hypothetical protein